VIHPPTGRFPFAKSLRRIDRMKGNLTAEPRKPLCNLVYYLRGSICLPFYPRPPAGVRPFHESSYMIKVSMCNQNSVYAAKASRFHLPPEVWSAVNESASGLPIGQMKGRAQTPVNSRAPCFFTDGARTVQPRNSHRIPCTSKCNRCHTLGPSPVNSNSPQVL
jgi:hypothetical protein